MSRAVYRSLIRATVCISLVSPLAACQQSNSSGVESNPGATGGRKATGGLISTGGTGSGGLTNTGGVQGSGGTMNSGGVSSTGGIPSLGGVAVTGGAAGMAGANSGGAAGSAATGGMAGTGSSGKGGATGPAASGGVAGTGGTGGAPKTGGVSLDAGADSSTAKDRGAPTSCGSIPDLKAMLLGFPPADPALALLLKEYVDDLGPLACSTEGTGTTRTVSQVIVVPPNAIYDGRGERIVADLAGLRCETGEGQSENQLPFFLLAPGAELRNLTITNPGCEGVHMMGDNVLDGIVWEDVGEDAASVRSYFPGGNIAILNSKAYQARDKIFQFNTACSIQVKNFVGDGMGKFLKQMGVTTVPVYIDLNTVTVTDVMSAVVLCETPLCWVRHHNLVYKFRGTDKPEYVFREVAPANVTQY